MIPKSLIFTELRDLLQGLPLLVEDHKSDIRITCDADIELEWKGEKFRFQDFNFLWSQAKFFRADSDELLISHIPDFTNFQKIRKILASFKDLLFRENIHSKKLWPDTSRYLPSGFSESKLNESQNLLKELYEDALMVPEKKGLVLDLDLCQGPNLIGIDPGQPGILDAASQIASLALGNNHPQRRSMLLRPELRRLTSGTEASDVKDAFSRLLIEQSGLPFVRFVNSGAEAMETAVLSLLNQYPERRKVIAFNGSFHGRCLLALHATHSPAKRAPFEFFPERIQFLDFPENKNPTIDPADPRQWAELFSESDDQKFHKMVSALSNSADSQLKEDLRCLLELRQSLKLEKPLAVVVEPMQCEGGDRYATSRFFRGLRYLTRALDVALVFDEVQTGLGLGGNFFWFHQFNLRKLDGSSDYPDALYMAKKAQVGFALSNFALPGCDEYSPASLYRGYIQANEIYDWDPSVLEGKIRSLLKIFQSGLGDDIILAPRNKGLSFAFDLPSAEILNAMIKIRFDHGLLFYPAGTQTARFRVTRDIRDEQLLQIFINLFHCAHSVAVEHNLHPNMNAAEWIEDLPEDWADEISENPALIRGKFENFPRRLEEIHRLNKNQWDKVFKKLILEIPQLLHSNWNSRFTIDQPPQSLDELWALHRRDPQFSLLDFFWISARFFGTHIRRMQSSEADSREAEVRALEELVYEAERVSPADFICAQAKNPESIVLISEGSGGEVRGLCVAVPLHLCKDVPLVATDKDATPDSGVLYSYDLTIHPGHQGLGLGLRLKIEQYIAAHQMGVRKIKSRNRYPEAFAMDALNHKLGAVTLQKNLNDYGGKATALYQSLNLPPPDASLFSVKETALGSLLNKMTLSNFVSRSFIFNTKILAEFLPKELRHIYYASGRSEAIEKSMRLVRHFRPEAKTFLSVEGDSFAYTTACGGSLGGDPKRNRYFDWPLVKSPEELDQLLSHSLDPKKVFAFYLEPMRLDQSRKSLAELKSYKTVCNRFSIPLVFNESNSWGWRYNSETFLAGCGEVLPDISVFFAGGQLGVVAAQKTYFLDKALMMISTWDGDDYSLNLVKEKIFETKESLEHA